MSKRSMITMDGNEAVASVAHRINEVIAIYPITPSSNMGEWADEWSARGKKNVWGTVPSVVRDAVRGRRRRRGARRAAGRRAHDDLHGVAGPAAHDPQHVQDRGRADRRSCMHVSARALATHALSIFGDHSDVMAVRQTGFGLLASGIGAGGPRLRAHRAARHAEVAACPSSTSSTGSAPRTRWPKIELLDGRGPAPDDHRRPGGGAPGARPHAGPAGAARHGPEPRRLLPGARGLQRLLHRLPRSTCRRRWTTSPASPGASTTSFEYVGHPEAERVHRDDGLGRRGGARDRREPGRPGREGGPGEGAALPALPARRAS